MANVKDKLISLSLAGDLEGVKDLLKENPNLPIDSTDSSGMTALQQAAFRGNLGLCQYLLERGADVNSNKHENQYTTLMFAALSGNEDVVNLMLEADAKPDAVNSVNRNAAEMASFVGQYHIAGVINNFLPSKDLSRFTKPTGLEQEEKLTARLLKPFHSLICDSNVNPVHLLLKLKEVPEIVESSKSLCQVLDQLAIEKMAAHNTNECLALKLHYLSCLLRLAASVFTSTSPSLDSLLKKFARGRRDDGVLENMEQFIRSTLRSFPRADSNLLIMMVQRLANVKVGDDPTSLRVITDSITGNRMDHPEGSECELCSARNPKRCTGCYLVFYCSQVCQKLHRPTHKLV